MHWKHGKFTIREGLKPESSHFQYFFVVREEGRTICNYCVWITDDAIGRFGSSGDFDSIVSSHREAWKKWVTGKIDAGDFGSKVLKFEKSGEKEIELSQMSDHLSME